MGQRSHGRSKILFEKFAPLLISSRVSDFPPLYEILFSGRKIPIFRPGQGNGGNEGGSPG